MKFDFSGWATKNDLVCGDGRIIRQDAFKANDGEIVPLVWNHQHNDASNVLGHALLKNAKDGVRAYLSFNDTENGRTAKEAVAHGDIRSLSIFANHLKQRGNEVLHGAIREVSLVIAGANPGARIDDEGFAHSSDGADAWMVYTPDIPLELYHSDYEDEYYEDDEDEYDPEEDYDDEYDDEEYDEDSDYEDEDYDDEYDGEDDYDSEYDDEMAHSDDEETIDPKKVYNSLNEEQKTLVHYMVGKALEENSDEEEEDEVKHNLFENEQVQNNVLTHSDETAIMDLAKKSGSFQDAFKFYCEQNELCHDDIAASSGFSQPPTTGNVTELFPEYKNLGPAAPELITNDQGWIGVVLNKVHKSPFSRIRTRYVDIRNIDTLRAKGYEKGTKKKLTGNFVLAKRETDPQTVYVKNALHKDDITDITDFDYVQYMYNIDKMMLNEELATAFLIGDGRSIEDEDKISPEHIRPIWTDDELYTIHKDIDLDTTRSDLQGSDTGVYFGENYIHAEAMVNACLYAREDYKGSGQPDMYIHPHELNIMLLARDRNGRRIYSSKAELAAALNVGNIYTVEQFLNKTRTEGEGQAAKTKKLLALIVNLADYNVGSTKGGEVSHFTQFDIDYNQQKSLIETRVSGALTRIKSAIAIEQEVDPN